MRLPIDIIDFDSRLHRKLRTLAMLEGVSVEAIVRDLIEGGLDARLDVLDFDRRCAVEQIDAAGRAHSLSEVEFEQLQLLEWGAPLDQRRAA